MYIIIKRDKADKLKEKMHHIKTMAMEVLDCIEEAAERHQEYSETPYREEARYRSVHPYSHEGHRDMPEYDGYEREMARRGRGRY